MKDRVKIFKLLMLALGLAATLGITSAGATSCTGANPNVCTDTWTMPIGFDRPVSMSKSADIDFGTVKLNACTYTISTAAVVTGTPSANCAALSGTPAAANISITGSSTQGLTLSVSGYTSDGTVTPSAATGKYGTNAEASFPMNVSAAGASGTTLKVGVTLTTAGSEVTTRTYTPTFTVSAVYQ